jgi:hypothetical protein
MARLDLPITIGAPLIKAPQAGPGEDDRLRLWQLAEVASDDGLADFELRGFDRPKTMMVCRSSYNTSNGVDRQAWYRAIAGKGDGKV